MCSHYKSVRDKAILRQAFGLNQLDDLGKPDLWPSYDGLFIRPHPHADVGDDAVPAREAVVGHWGLIPHWSKDGKVRGTFNARSETVTEKPTFRDAWRKGQRCIIPAMSVYEPDWRSSRAVAAEISRADGEPMGIAGIWSTWRSPTGWVDSYTMLTVNADDHALFKLLHKPQDEKRMVVILNPDSYEAWLTGAENDVKPLIRQCSAESLQLHSQEAK
jgi:putative SOS response-associated peptidase YedK